MGELFRKMISNDPSNPAANNPKSSVIPREAAAQKPMNDHAKGIAKR